MPVTLMDRLPLPNLKVYTAGSVVLLALALYHAVGVTSDPAWRANTTLQRAEAAAAVEAAAAADTAPAASTAPAAYTAPAADTAPAHDQLPSGPPLPAGATRNVTDQFVDIMTFMMQEPLCMWTLINMCYCVLALVAWAVQRAVFGSLRVAEAQRVKDKLWNYVFYKFIFVFGVVNVQYMDEVLLWCSWFTLLGFLHLLANLCKDRFEYLLSTARTAGWAHARLVSLLAGIVCASTALLAVALAAGHAAGRHTFAFMAAECILVLVLALHVLARCLLQLYEADVAGPLAYYTHLAFDSVSLCVELGHVVHMVWYSKLLVSMPSLVLLMQLRHVLHELQARLRKHRLYTALATHMSQNYPMASKEEVEKNQDNCAICWEPMKEARKLPCSHLFHNSCLCQWVQQDASCPTCRRALHAAPAQGPPLGPPGVPPRAPPTLVAAATPLPVPPPPDQPNHLFHFDGSRYVSWLPSFSVEVTRVRATAANAPAINGHIESMARQVQQLFPQYSVSSLAADLSLTRSADATVNNILEGRLPPRAQDRHRAAQLGSPQPAPAAGPPAAPSVTWPRPLPDLPTRSHSDTPAQQDTAPESQSSAAFSSSAREREAALARRKAQLVAGARRRYLAREAAPRS